MINGATNNITATVNVGFYPSFAAVNSVTDKIYVENYCGDDDECQHVGTVTVINGATNTTTPVNVGFSPDSVAVNAVTNNIYVANALRQRFQLRQCWDGNSHRRGHQHHHAGQRGVRPLCRGRRLRD